MFREILKEIVQSTPGARAAVVMGYDGITVDTFARPGYPTNLAEAVGMEFTVILSQVRSASQMLEAGAARTLTLQNEDSSTVFALIDARYFLALHLDAGGNTGKGKYLMRMHRDRLAEELR